MVLRFEYKKMHQSAQGYLRAISEGDHLMSDEAIYARSGFSEREYNFLYGLASRRVQAHQKGDDAYEEMLALLDEMEDLNWIISRSKERGRAKV